MKNAKYVRPKLLESLSWGERRALHKEYRACNGFTAKVLYYAEGSTIILAGVSLYCWLTDYSFFQMNGKPLDGLIVNTLMLICGIASITGHRKFRQWLKDTKNIAVSASEVLELFPKR